MRYFPLVLPLPFAFHLSPFLLDPATASVVAKARIGERIQSRASEHLISRPREPRLTFRLCKTSNTRNSVNRALRSFAYLRAALQTAESLLKRTDYVAMLRESREQHSYKISWIEKNLHPRTRNYDPAEYDVQLRVVSR